MGATTFTVLVRKGEGKATALEAFEHAHKRAQFEHGHSGYTGTIAEKTSFVKVSLPAGKSTIEDAHEHAYALLDEHQPYPAHAKSVGDKWGPAGCIELPNAFFFFGWASE